MNREIFLKTERLAFSKWSKADTALAQSLWGNEMVTKYICASGTFSDEEIIKRLHLEIENDRMYGLQYWPVFHKNSGELIGCCGLRPHDKSVFELGIHLRPEFWRKGYAVEAVNAVIDYAFSSLHATALYAGHNPKNMASQKLLQKLEFQYIGDEFYAPTGLYHPSYLLQR